MTTVSLSPSRSRWLRAFLYGIFAEIATIVTIIAVMLIYRFGYARGLSDAAYDAFGQKAGGIIGVIAGTLFVYLFARALMRRLASDFIAHGLVVAMAAIALSVGGSIAGHHGVPAGYLLASALKLLAGGGAGWLAARRMPEFEKFG
jgi:hypothetical protein